MSVLSGLLQTQDYARAILTVEPCVMAAQLAHLAGMARLPNVEHAGLLGGFAVAERAAYVETAVAGQVFEDAEIITGLRCVNCDGHPPTGFACLTCGARP
jgi:xanthine dehydrogenase iron-sulfur cluster and FAD-binding subunit A